MTRQIRARYSGGKLQPLDPVDLAEGEVVVVSLPESAASVELAREALRSTAGAWRGLVDTDALKRDIAEGRRVSRPRPTL